MNTVTIEQKEYRELIEENVRLKYESKQKEFEFNATKKAVYEMIVYESSYHLGEIEKNEKINYHTKEVFAKIEKYFNSDFRGHLEKILKLYKEGKDEE